MSEHESTPAQVYLVPFENEYGETHYRPQLKVGDQIFAFWVSGLKRDAEWYADMLRKALRKAGATCTE